MRVTAITPMKNEGPFILEWIAYHRLIGITDFMVFTNDCADGTDLILDRLDDLGIVRHMPNPSILTQGEGGHHWAAMRYANAFGRLRRADWIVSFDVDEFICVNAGKGRLTDLFAAVPAAQFVSMNQLNFGCAGQETYDPDRPLLAQFDRAMSHDDQTYGWTRARGVKTISRGDAPFRWLGNHSPDLEEAAVGQVIWVNGDGRPVAPEVYTKSFKSAKAEAKGYDLVQLNHYALRSMENFLVKTERGDANRVVEEEARYWKQYWNQYDDNMVEDRRIQRWLPDVQAELDTLMQDGILARLHHAAVDWHRDAIARLRQTDLQASILKQVRGLHKRKLVKDVAA